MADKALEKIALNDKEKALIKGAQSEAKKRGLSVFTWLKMSGVDLGKKGLKKKDFETPNIMELEKKPIIIGAPKPPIVDKVQTRTKSDTMLFNNSQPKAEKNSKHMMIETELKNPILRTQFDKILRIVENADVISASDVKEKTNIPSGTLKECYKMLQRAEKIRLEYPLFGSPLLISLDYEKEKKRAELAKKGIRLEDSDEDI